MKITSEDCKAAIVDWTQLNGYALTKEYGAALSAGEDDNWATIWNRNNWKRRSKRSHTTSAMIIREFDCEAFDKAFAAWSFPDKTDKALRAYVYTNMADTEILSVIVQGEKR